MRSTINSVQLACCAVCALTLLPACRQRGGEQSTVSVTTAALTNSGSILGFEEPSLWIVPGVSKASSALHTQGSKSLAVAARGYVALRSVPLGIAVPLGDKISLDLRLPADQGQPYWRGAVQLYITAATRNVYDAYVGQVELTGVPAAVFRTIDFNVPSNIRASIGAGATDLTVTIALNVPADATGAYLLDNLRLAPSAPDGLCVGQPDSVACDDGNPCTRNDSCVSGLCAGDATAGCTYDPVTAVADVDWHGPLVLKASAPDCGDSLSRIELASNVAFTIPSGIALAGPAGAVTLNLGIAKGQQAHIYCQYVDSSNSSQPRTAIFAGCSDGSTAGRVVEAGRFSLSFTAAPQPLAAAICGAAPNTAALDLSVDTLRVLAEPFSPEETRSIRQGFSWSGTAPVPELDGLGRPLLYYALVYVENPIQLSYLDSLEVHHDALPIIGGIERWAGQVGVFTHHGDGEGTLRFALLTGGLYNRLRAGALDGKIPFPVVVLRSPPREFSNSDGLTVSYEALASARFGYRGKDAFAVSQQPLTSHVLCSSVLGGAVKDFVSATAGIAEGTANLVNHYIGVLVGTSTGVATVNVTMAPMNTDPTFNILKPGAAYSVTNPDVNFDAVPLTQAWGYRAGARLTLRGAEIRARGIHVPSFYSGSLDATGSGNLQMNVQTDTAICLNMENAAVKVIDMLTPVEFCDFTGYRVRSATVATGFNINIRHDFANVMAQMTDSQDFSTRVLRFTPGAASALVGHFADPFPTAFTPCLTLPLMSTFAIPTALALYAHVVNYADPVATAWLATVGSCMYTVDAIIPSREGVARSRGAAVHEYGHWFLCSVLDSMGDVAGLQYNNAILQSIAPPLETVGDCGAACGNEAIADFFSGQVVGGAAYYSFNESVEDISTWFDSDQRGIMMNYCPDTSTDCFEDNVGGADEVVSGWVTGFTGSDFVRARQKGRVMSTIHDFFDSPAGAAPGDRTSAGSFWSLPTQPGPLVLHRGVGAVNDEAVWLSGVDLQTAIRQRRGLGLGQTELIGGLVDRAKAAGYTWCEICRLLALHQPTVSATMSRDEFFDFCQNNSFIQSMIGAPPSGVDSSCTPLPIVCPPGQIVSTDMTCIDPPCPNGEVLNFDGLCTTACDSVYAQSVRVDVVRNGRCVVVVP